MGLCEYVKLLGIIGDRQRVLNSYLCPRSAAWTAQAGLLLRDAGLVCARARATTNAPSRCHASPSASHGDFLRLGLHTPKNARLEEGVIRT